MKIDIINLTDAQFNNLSYEQRKVLYEAQEKKNEMEEKLAEDMLSAKLSLIALGTARSDMLNMVYMKLSDEYDNKVQNLAYITLDAMSNAGGESSSAPTTSEEKVYDKTNPDYTLSAQERFSAVKKYYSAIEDPEERYEEFCADTAVKGYLGEYYDTMDFYLKSFL